MRTRSITTTARIALVVLSAGLVTTACRSKPAAQNGSPTAPASASATGSPNAGPEHDSLAAYRGMWAAFVEAAKTSNPDASDLRKYASDDALKLIVSGLVTNRDQKKVILGDLKIDPRVTAMTPTGAPTEASILDCVNDEKWLVYKSSGGLVNDKPGGKHRTTATVKMTADGWKVSRFAIGDQSC